MLKPSGLPSQNTASLTALNPGMAYLPAASTSRSMGFQPGAIGSLVDFGPFSPAPSAPPAVGASGGFLIWNDASPTRSSQRLSTRAVAGSVFSASDDVDRSLQSITKHRKAKRRRGLKDSTCIKNKPHHKERVSGKIFETFSPFDERFPAYMAHEPLEIRGFQAHSPFSQEFECVSQWPSSKRARKRSRNVDRVKLVKKYIGSSRGQKKSKNWHVRSYHQHLVKRSNCGSHEWESVSPFDSKFRVLTTKPGVYQPKTSTQPHAKGLIVCSPWDERYRVQCQLGWWQEDDTDGFSTYSPFDNRFPSRFSPFTGGRTKKKPSPLKQMYSPEPRSNGPWTSPMAAAPAAAAFPRMTPVASGATTSLSFHISPNYTVPVGFSSPFIPQVPQLN
ncbi:hypothetical protein FOL47_000041 [Perkinsus chesapeaki]|uniref:Uncharacterized protein n=1 Tax=Perkinsus chesapeaki TaxID=330153 RepID=A0A7J6N312_PERCH|nr:hypothetical protein FOL47_000041 [Perkinsus chesapeaki]